jgi:hypothetical protein
VASVNGNQLPAKLNATKTAIRAKENACPKAIAGDRPTKCVKAVPGRVCSRRNKLDIPPSIKIAKMDPAAIAMPYWPKPAGPTARPTATLSAKETNPMYAVAVH